MVDSNKRRHEVATCGCKIMGRCDAWRCNAWRNIAHGSNRARPTRLRWLGPCWDYGKEWATPPYRIGYCGMWNELLPWGTLGYGSKRAETATCGINRAGRDAFQNSTGSRGILCRAIPCKETMTCGIYRVGRDTVQNHTGSRGIPCHVGYNAVSDTKSCGIPRQPHVGAPCRVGYRANRTCRR